MIDETKLLAYVELEYGRAVARRVEELMVGGMAPFEALDAACREGCRKELAATAKLIEQPFNSP